ncbi:substrate-binding domain-containing protein [Propionibacterium sp.]|uniref:substrate-binding domain-containing protein n=1 Tax=Propionibacterium sp. TaxID=1977903 RepID=UPI0039EC75FF
MVLPLQGPGGLYGPSAMASAELAAQEINDDGGLLGQQIELEWVDGGEAPGAIARDVDQLISHRGIQAIAGWHISSVRNALVPVVAGRVPYVYPALYEGGEARHGVYCTGEKPEAYLLPALRWFQSTLGVRRWFLMGDDYIWPRRVCELLEQRAASLGVSIAGHRFLSYGRPDPIGMQCGLDTIRASHCEGVISLMIGQNSVDFHRAFAQAGLPDSVVRLCPLSDENVLMANGAPNNEGLYAASAYFNTLTTEPALDFIGRYYRFYGDGAPALCGPAESCVESLDALVALVRKAGSLSTTQLDRVVNGTSFRSPRGTVRFRGNEIQQAVYLGRSDGLRFDVLTDID